MARIHSTGIGHIGEFGTPQLINATVVVDVGMEFEVVDLLESTIHGLQVTDIDDGELQITCWQSMQGVLHRATASM